MTTNRYFRSNFIQGPDQRLLNSLTIETIQLKGRDVLYIPRELVAFDRLYGEDKLSAFSASYEVEMYIENFNSFEGDRELVSHYGFEVRDEIRLAVVKTRFEDVITASDSTIVRPREGDLIFFPLDKSLFEISYLENEAVYYQLGGIFTYTIHCKRYEQGSETFNTGIPEIDDTVSMFNSNAVLNLAPGGSGSFESGEIVYQGADIGTGTFFAEVISFDPIGRKIIVTKTRNEVSAAPLIGFASGAQWTVVENETGCLDQTGQSTNAANLNEVIDQEAVATDAFVRAPRNPLAW